MEIFHQIKSDPLRAFLSLFGVSVGIFVVSLSFALVEAFSAAVKAGFDHFGSDMVMLERFPVTSGGEDGGSGSDWSRFAARPQPSWQDFVSLQGGPFAWTALAAKADCDVSAQGKMLRQVKLLGVGGQWQHLVYSSVCAGRDFSLAELAGREAKVIIGAKIASQLFGTGDDPSVACGQSLRTGDRSLTVTGVLSQEGKNLISLYATDYAIVVPFATAWQIAGLDNLETMVAVGPGSGGQDAAVAQVRRIVRSGRRLQPAQDDDFAVNTMEELCRQTMSITGKISAAGVLIALFSLLIGGFGIVNIMLVSVRERSWQIGLKMALGAHRRRILLEFLSEALLLTATGAALGLLLSALACALIPATLIKVALSPRLALLAGGIALVLGLVSGVAPALQASRLNPVDALRG